MYSGLGRFFVYGRGRFSNVGRGPGGHTDYGRGRGAPHYDWRLHPEVVGEIWEKELDDTALNMIDQPAHLISSQMDKENNAPKLDKHDVDTKCRP